MTMPSVAPICSASASAGTTMSSPSPMWVLRGLMYSTGAFGAALYGAWFTASPSAASASRWFNSAP
jgi:hypothetical protein